jgi:hypothetical protein
LRDMGIREIEALDDSSLVVQQIKGESQCLDGTLNKYHDRCLDLIKLLDMFHISHIPRERNGRANTLAQQASRYEVRRGLFMIKENSMITLVDTICDNLAAAVGETRITREARPTVEHDMGGHVGYKHEWGRERGKPTRVDCVWA